MRITKQDIERATDNHIDPWAVSDGLLYRLCRQYPYHQDVKGVTAKMLLIGRAYAADQVDPRRARRMSSSTSETYRERFGHLR
jgi:hypothetical protein